MRRTLRFDLPELAVGTAEYDDGPTGCTVLSFPAGAACAVDTRGGAVAGRDLEAVRPSDTWSEIDAIVFAGGSVLGLDAAHGVAHRLYEERGYTGDYLDLPVVPAAAVYDFAGRKNTIYPDVELGMRAFDAARPGEVVVGRAGAGVHTTVGSYFGERFAEPGGQGAAFLSERGLKLFALVVVNACGNLLDRDGKVFRGTRDPATGGRARVKDRLLRTLAERKEEPAPRRGSHTVLAAVVTNLALERHELARLAVMGHAGLARMFEPFHTPEDGDAVFACSLQSARMPRGVRLADVGVLAADLLMDAALDSVR